MSTPTTSRKISLSAPQQRLLDDAQRLVAISSVSAHHGLLVSGHRYRTAIALERKGLATVRYQGSSMGWVLPAGLSS